MTDMSALISSTTLKIDFNKEGGAMYVIAMKNRPNEFYAMKSLQEHDYLKPNMLPLVEIIKETYEYDKLMDNDTGKPLKEPRICKDGRTRHYDMLDLNTKRDITLRKITEYFPERDVLIDYFRCDLRRYHYDASKIELVLELNRDLDLYCKKVLGIRNYPHLIPVITVKRKMDYVLSPEQVISLANELRNNKPTQRIALRIDDIEGYEDAARQILRANDLLIYDFNEQPIKSKPVECMQLKQLALPAQLVALCSPRRRELSGKDFSDHANGEATKLIDNSHLTSFAKHGFDGVGDYGGLRDNLPDSGSNKGRALALMYDGNCNSFRVYINDNYQLGARGYWEVVDNMLKDPALEQGGDCLALSAIEEKFQKHDKDYTFAEWIKYTLIRYIQQLATNAPELL